MKYRFSGFLLDPARHRLLAADGQPVNLNSRVFDTLKFMVEHPGELLDKAALMQAVWPDTVVEENNLNQAVTALRKALGEKPGDHRFILTEPGRGYRFVAEVEVLEDPPVPEPAQPDAGIVLEPGSKLKSRRWGTPSAAVLVVGLSLIVAYMFYQPDSEERTSLLPSEPVTSVLVTPPPVPQSVAVLPFADMSPAGDQAYFADGIAEELLNELSRVDGLHVAGRTSSFSFRDKDQDLPAIGRQLNVAHILEGSVRKAGDRVRISVQLVKAADGYHVWSQSFDRSLEDIFAIQDEIAAAVADSLSVTLGVGGPDSLSRHTPSFESYDAVLEARALMRRSGRENYARAIELLEAVVRSEPDYAEAWNSLSEAYWSSANVFIAERAEEYLEKSNQAATRAVALAPEAVWSLRTLSGIHMQAQNWLEAERLLQEARSLTLGDPTTNEWIGWFLRTVGRPGDSIDYLRRAIEVEPLALSPCFQLAVSLQSHGETEAALRQIEHCESLVGDHSLLEGLALVLAMEIDDREMFGKYMDRLDSSPDTPQSAQDFSVIMRDLYDSPAAAREYLRGIYQEPAYQDPLSRAVISIYASFFGDPELALEMFWASYRQGTLLFDAVWREVYAPTRQLPGFKDLVREAGLVDYWRASGNWGEFCRPVGDDDFECR